MTMNLLTLGREHLEYVRRIRRELHRFPEVGTDLPRTRALVLRDLRLVWARRGDALQPALFALLTVVLFALGLGGMGSPRFSNPFFTWSSKA